MRMSQSTILGPFIEVLGSRKRNVPKVKRQCPNHPTDKQGDAKFCSKCGTEVVNVDYTKEETIELRNLLWNNGFEDSLYSPEGFDQLLIPNNYPPERIAVDGYDEGIIDLTNTDISLIKKTQLYWLLTTFRGEIDLMITTFGLENVKLKWGLISYWS